MIFLGGGGQEGVLQPMVRSVFRFLANAALIVEVTREFWKASSSVTLWWHQCLQMMLFYWHHETVGTVYS